MALHLGDDGLCHFTLHQSACPLGGDFAQYRGVFRIFEQVPHRPGFTLGVVEVGCSNRVFLEVCIAFDECVQAVTHFEAALRQHDGGLHQGGPGQLAILLVRFLQHAHGARGAYRAAAHHAFHERHGLAIGLDKQFFIGCSWGGLPPIERFYFFAVEVQ